MAQRERLILVDASSLIYRAYFALPASFRTSSGLPTNAIYGFATMFRKVLGGKTPEYGAAVFDAPGPTHRDEKYPEYKSNRPPMDLELRAQLPWIDKVVEAHHFPIVRKPGWEADDVIGTLARQARARDMEVHIISGDKDFAQLIDDRTRMIDTLRDITYDPELVRKKWGVKAEQFVDFLALLGDKVDNIPGVPGIGQKGAGQLLAKYGSLAGVLENVEELKGRQKNNLIEFRSQALLSQELATIDCEVPLEETLEDFRLNLPSSEELNELYRELEFYSLLGEEAKKEQDASTTETRIERDASALLSHLKSWQEESGHPVAVLPCFDLPSPVHGKLASLVFSGAEGEAILFPVNDASEALQELKDWFEDEKIRKSGHHVKELWICLRKQGITLRGIEGALMLESFLVDPTGLIPHRLDQIARQFLHSSLPPHKEVLGAGKNEKKFSELEPEDYVEWAGQRAEVVFRAQALVRERLVEEEQEDSLRKVDLPLMEVLGQMEIDGIRVDADELKVVGIEFAEKLEGISKEIYALAGREFNLASPKQLGAVLFEELELPIIKRTKTGYSTNAEVLERLASKHPIANLILEHRKLAKLINTYTDVLQREVSPKTGRVHATFQQTVGATGRIISTEPDLQRTPVKTPEGKRIREAFVAPEGTQLIAADWSQIELRLLAHVTEDEHLLDAFANDVDVHKKTASQIFSCSVEEVSAEQRSIGKLVNFSTIYGQGANSLGKIIGVPKKEAQAYIDGYFEAYQGVRSWLDKTISEAHSKGYVTTIFGRRRYIPELSSRAIMERQAGERIAANTPIQGSAADICKLAMLNIADRLREQKLQSKMLMQIHDELVFESPDAEVEEVAKLVKEEMEQVVELQVPLIADVGWGKSWADAKEA